MRRLIVRIGCIKCPFYDSSKIWNENCFRHVIAFNTWFVSLLGVVCVGLNLLSNVCCQLSPRKLFTKPAEPISKNIDRVSTRLFRARKNIKLNSFGVEIFHNILNSFFCVSAQLRSSLFCSRLKSINYQKRLCLLLHYHTIERRERRRKQIAEKKRKPLLSVL